MLRGLVALLPSTVKKSPACSRGRRRQGKASVFVVLTDSEKSLSPCFWGDYRELCKLLGDLLQSLSPFLEYQFVDSHFFSSCNITSIVIPEDIFC